MLDRFLFYAPIHKRGCGGKIGVTETRGTLTTPSQNTPYSQISGIFSEKMTISLEKSFAEVY